MSTIITVILVALALFVLAILLYPKGATILASLSRYGILDDLSSTVAKAQSHGQVKDVVMEVVYDEGRFRIEVVDGTGWREIVAQRMGQFKVAVSFVPTANYPQAPTFDVASERSSITNDPSRDLREVREQLERLIREGLMKKGFSEADASAANLHVAYHRVIKGKYGRMGVEGNDDDPNAVEAERDRDGNLPKLGCSSLLAIEHALILEFFDTRSGELIWRAAIQADLLSDVSSAERERRIRLAIAAMAATYPPPIKRVAIHGT